MSFFAPCGGYQGSVPSTGLAQALTTPPLITHIVRWTNVVQTRNELNGHVINVERFWNEQVTKVAGICGRWCVTFVGVCYTCRCCYICGRNSSLAPPNSQISSSHRYLTFLQFDFIWGNFTELICAVQMVCWVQISPRDGYGGASLSQAEGMSKHQVWRCNTF